MSSTINIDDYVGILDGTEKGHVIKIEKNKAWIETDEGFEMISQLNKLVKYPQKKPALPAGRKVEKKKIKQVISNKNLESEEFPTNKKPVIQKVKDKNFNINPLLIGEETKAGSSRKRLESIWEVDLHIDELTDHYKHLTNGEIVDLQLRHARMIIEKAGMNKIGKVVFIHGKGKGTLRLELLNLLRGYTFLEYYDASFKLYGGGATEVKIFTSKV